MMGWFSQALVFGVVLFIAGTGIPLMAALNAGLGAGFGNPVPAAFVLFLLALTITAVLALTNPLPSKAEITAMPLHYYLGGVFVAFYVLSITWIAPKIGLGNAIFAVLLGQLVGAAIIDHFGLLNIARTPITTARIAGIGLMVIGIYLAKKPVIDV